MRDRRRRSEIIGTNLPPINTHGDKAASYCCKFKKLQYTDFCIEKCSIQINFISNCNIINTHRVAISEACTRLPIIIKTHKAAIYDLSSAKFMRQPFLLQQPFTNHHQQDPSHHQQKSHMAAISEPLTYLPVIILSSLVIRTSSWDFWLDFACSS